MIVNRITHPKVEQLFVAFVVAMFFSCAAIASGVPSPQEQSVSSAQIVQQLQKQANRYGVTLKDITIHKNYSTDNGGRINPYAVQGCTISTTVGVPPLQITISVTADTCEEARDALLKAIGKLV